MAQKLQPARGTKDIIEDYPLFHHVQQTAKEISERFGFEQVATPIFEFTEVFKRTLGEHSDVVSKEMYSFDDRGGEGMTLRPEFTAGVVRAFINSSLVQSLPAKLFSTGPLFRYERPQKGRQRQFHQVNFELFGAAEPIADVEMIALGNQLLKLLGISTGITLEINSLGDKETRQSYHKALVEYLQDYKDELSDDSKIRLEHNPLRILDSKNENDQRIIEASPALESYYSVQAKEHFAAVCDGLGLLGIAFTHNKKLVRGLDYYTHTAFEFTTDQLGAQNAVLAGGRYDGLVEQMGGPKTPAVGFAGGVERLVALMQVEPAAVRPIHIVPVGQQAEKAVLPLAMELRQAGLCVEFGYHGNVGKRMKKAAKVNAIAAIIMGDDELQSGRLKVKEFDAGVEEEVLRDDLRQYLTQLISR